MRAAQETGLLTCPNDSLGNPRPPVTTTPGETWIVKGMNSKGRVDPRHISRNYLLALGHPTSPIKAIRAHCVDCSGGSSSEARKCTVIDCPLWPMRMGVNVFHASARGA